MIARGIGRRFAVSIGAAVIASATAGTASAAWGSDVNEIGISTKPPVGTARTDGVLTVGKRESAIVKGPPKLRLTVEIGVPTTSPGCDDFQSGLVCLPDIVRPAPKSPPFQTSRKGHARVTFVMPSTYKLFNFNDPTQSNPLNFVNGQTVALLVLGNHVKRTRHGTSSISFSVGETTATVEVPPPPTP